MQNLPAVALVKVSRIARVGGQVSHTLGPFIGGDSFTMSNNENPASRLLSILTEARSMGDNKKTREVWGKVLGVNPNDNSLLLPTFAKFLLLIQETRKSIEAVEELNKELYLKPIAKIETTFRYINFEENWQRLKRELDDVTMAQLEFCADRLNSYVSVRSIAPEELARLLEEVNKLIADVIETNIEADLKSFVVRGLEEIRRAIIEYRISGLEGLRRALELNLGAILFNRDRVQRNKQKKSVKAYLELVYLVVKTVSIALEFPQLTDGVIQMLSPGN